MPLCTSFPRWRARGGTALVALVAALVVALVAAPHILTLGSAGSLQ